MSLLGNIFSDGKSKVERIDLSKRYNLIARVGQGSMSKVWRAEDAMGGRAVAVKVLDKEKTKRYEARFPGLHKPNEGDIALSLHHPYIVKTHEVGLTLEDEMYLVMDYVDGSGLSLLVDLQSDQMRRFRLRYMIQIGEALDYFHKKNWIHRDICPRNIMVTENDQIQLIDFGLTVPNTADFRKPGNRTGTANYMAPELIKRQPTDQRIDVFSYAVTCFEMYTKRHPWDAAMTIDAVLQHINKEPLQLKKLVPTVDSQIAEAIMKGLAANPAERWQTVAEMVTELRAAEVRLVKVTKEALIKKKQAALKIAAARKRALEEKATQQKATAATPAAATPTAATPTAATPTAATPTVETPTVETAMVGTETEQTADKQATKPSSTVDQIVNDDGPPEASNSAPNDLAADHAPTTPDDETAPKPKAEQESQGS